MEANPPSGPLRPLTLGELLDRAVTLCVRFFVPLAIVEAVSAGAQCAYAIYAGVDVGSFWTGLAGEIGGNPVVAAPAPGGANGLGLLLLLVVQPFVGGALIAMTCSLYLGLPTSFRQAYRTAAQRGVRLATLAVIFFFFATLVLIAFFAVLVAVGATFASGSASLGGIGRPAALAVAVLLGVACALALGTAAAALLVAFSLSSITCVLEGASAVRAIALCARRSFGKARLRRTLIFAAANLAILAACELVVNAATLALPFLRGGLRGNAFETVAFGLAALLGNAFCCAFYFDLRVREEGYDLRLAASALRPLRRGRG